MLVLDLAWTTTGWVVFNYMTDEPVTVGQFAARNKTGQPASNEASYVGHMAEQVYNNVVEVAGQYYVDLIVYEYTDWHRNIVGGRKTASQRRKELAIEIQTQRTLGRTEGLMAVIGTLHGYKIVGVGVNEVKRSFSATSKTGVARMVAGALPQFYTYTDDKNKPLLEIASGKKLSHHISDALGIALHVSQKMRMDRALSR
jgi:hypothetical protein